jgi:hypothetical protein
LWVNGVVSVIWALVAIAVTRPFLLLGLFTLAVSIGFSILLLRGSRVIWVLIVAGSVLTFAFAPFEGVHWWTIPATILDLGLLLAPSSRRYVWRARPRSLPQTGQSSMDPQSTPDSERPKGW